MFLRSYAWVASSFSGIPILVITCMLKKHFLLLPLGGVIYCLKLLSDSRSSSFVKLVLSTDMLEEPSKLLKKS